MTKQAIEIAGAGPAGLAAAVMLAKAGKEVVVHEAYKEVGHRFGSLYQDFQGLENWTTEQNVLELFEEQGLTTDFASLACYKGTAFDYKQRRYEISSEQPLFYMLERGPGPKTLDTALLKQAQSLGVEIKFNSRLRQITGQGIMAGGPKAADAISAGYHFATDMADGYWVICDDNLAPKGYSYLLIMDGVGTVKSCMFDDFKQEKKYVERTVAAFEELVDLKMTNPKFHGGIGNFYIPETAYNGQFPVIGEQAGFQDTLWGFGMRLVISSGLLAAQSLLTGENYDQLWRKQLKPQMDASVVNRCVFSLLGNKGYGWFLSKKIQGDARLSLRKEYQHSFLKRVLHPWAKRRYQSRRV
ncbi:MAG: flavin-dependent dehydrogenase [Methylophagaceae bacterium]|jgi:flavin-dependent dehydrogenase